MTNRRINQALWIGTAALCIGAITVVVAGLLMPLSTGENASPASHSVKETGSSTANPALPPLEAFDAALSKPLRRALDDVAAVQPAMASARGAAAAAGLSVTLVGTIGNSLAMLKSPDGTVALKAVGDQVGGAEVLAIRPGEVDVRFGGKAITLTKVKESAAAAPPMNPLEQ